MSPGKENGKLGRARRKREKRKVEEGSVFSIFQNVVAQRVFPRIKEKTGRSKQNRPQTVENDLHSVVFQS